MERLFASGRYLFMACCGPHESPDGLGLWTGDSNVGWEARYTLNLNYQFQTSQGNIGNLPEMMEGVFWFNEQMKEGEVLNAQKLLCCRGLLFGHSVCSQDGRILVDPGYPVWYGSGGMAWLLLAFWESYRCTGDVSFLRNRVYPMLRPMGDFYEDFLVLKDVNGKFIFAGSHSPENAPSGPGMCQLAVNAASDITGARSVLSWLIEMCETLGVDAEKIPKWKSILKDLPPYLINSQGAFAEWAWPPLLEHQNYFHSTSSVLRPFWPFREVTPDTNVTLCAAARETQRRKAPMGYERCGHGLVHAAFVATILNNGPFVAANLVDMVKWGLFFSSLATSNYPNCEVYWQDVSNAFPAILMESLVNSEQGWFELLPAIPSGLDTGVIRGVVGRSQFVVNELKWDVKSGHVSVVITSKKAQKLKIIHRKGFESFETKVPFTTDSPTHRTVQLAAGEKTTITATWRVNAAIRSG
jgi:hypothetical protein